MFWAPSPALIGSRPALADRSPLHLVLLRRTSTFIPSVARPDHRSIAPLHSIALPPPVSCDGPALGRIPLRVCSPLGPLLQLIWLFCSVQRRLPGVCKARPPSFSRPRGRLRRSLRSLLLLRSRSPIPIPRACARVGSLPYLLDYDSLFAQPNPPPASGLQPILAFFSPPLLSSGTPGRPLFSVRPLHDAARHLPDCPLPAQSVPLVPPSTPACRTLSPARLPLHQADSAIDRFAPLAKLPLPSLPQQRVAAGNDCSHIHPGCRHDYAPWSTSDPRRAYLCFGLVLLLLLTERGPPSLAISYVAR